MNRFSRVGLVVLVCAACMPKSVFAADAPSVTVHTVDETTRTGKLTALKDGQLVLSGPTTRISLEDVVNLEVANNNNAAPKQAPAHKLTGTVIGTEGSFKDQGSTRDKAFDGKLDTFFDPPAEHREDGFVGLDLGSPKIITQVKYCPRNGRNGFFDGRMVGCVFQGCDSPEFDKGVVTLYTISDRPENNKLTAKDVSVDRPVRYVRLTTGSDPPLNVSELEFWGKDVSDDEMQVEKGAGARATASTHPTTAPYKIRIRFNDDDQLTGTLVDWTDKQLSMDYRAFGEEPASIPMSALHRVWHGTQAQVDKAKGMTLEPGPEDAAFVLKDKDVVSVRGVTLGVEGDALKFKFNDQERKINLQKFVGVILGGQAPKPDRSFHQRIELPNGDAISGKWTGYDSKTHRLELQTSWGQSVSIPFTSIKKITSANGRLTYLSDLKPSNVEQTPYLDRLMPYQTDHSLTGGTLKLSDGEYQRGIAVHSRCVLTYDLDGAYETFKAKIGFQQPEGKLGEAPIRVLGDGKVIWQEEHARGDAQKPAEVSVSVTGVKQLSLEVDFGDNGDTGGRVDFVNGRLLRSATSPSN